MFRWTSCNHCYCIECADKVINDSLSIHNQPPKCMHSDCDQPLDHEHAQSIPINLRTALSPKYKTHREQMHVVSDYEQSESLVAGYLRIESPSDRVPNDVAWIIFDFFRLIYFSRTRCLLCECKGYEYMSCTQCEGRGKVESKCVHCERKDNRSGLITIDPYSYRDRLCIECGGTGTAMSLVSYRLCTRCKGTGSNALDHRNTNMNRYFWDYRRMKMVEIDRSCNYCRDSGSWGRQCSECEGRTFKVFPCRNCDGSKVVMALDFKKLCERQSLCEKCGLYSPNDQIVYWSGCGHIACSECCGKHIARELRRRRVPRCLKMGCARTLKVDTLRCSGLDRSQQLSAKLEHVINNPPTNSGRRRRERRESRESRERRVRSLGGTRPTITFSERNRGYQSRPLPPPPSYAGYPSYSRSRPRIHGVNPRVMNTVDGGQLPSHSHVHVHRNGTRGARPRIQRQRMQQQRRQRMQPPNGDTNGRNGRGKANVAPRSEDK